MPLSPQQQEQVRQVFTGLLKATFEKLHGLTLEARAVNPFLVRLLAKTPRDLAEFIVWQRLERGAVTSMGNRFQKIADLVSPFMRSSDVPGADLGARNEVLKRRVLMQVKSGPDTIDKDIAERIEAKLDEAENRLRTQGGLARDWVVVKMLGMCYGRPEHRSSWVQGLGRKGIDIDRIGRAFWEFVASDADAYRLVFEVADQVAASYTNATGKTLPEAIHVAIAGLEKEIGERYGDGAGGIDWGKLLEDNM